MLDIKFIRDNPELVQASAKSKGYDVSIKDVLALDDERRSLQQQADDLRGARNANAAKMKDGKPEQSIIDEGKQIKIELAERENYLKQAEERFFEQLHAIPNIIQNDVPLGGEQDSVEIKTFGEKNVGAKDHLEFALARDWVDFERGAKVAGAKFYYIKGDLALLELFLGLARRRLAIGLVKRPVILAQAAITDIQARLHAAVGFVVS